MDEKDKAEIGQLMREVLQADTVRAATRDAVREVLQADTVRAATRDEVREVLQADTVRSAIRQDMREVMRSEFKELFLDAFEPFATSIPQQIQKIDGEFQKLNKRLDGVEARLARLETQTSQALRRLDNIDATLGDLRATGRDERAEIQILKDRVADLEGRLTRIEAGRHE